MYAAMENKTSLIERMLDLGCDINAKNKVIAIVKLCHQSNRDSRLFLVIIFFPNIVFHFVLDKLLEKFPGFLPYV